MNKTPLFLAVLSTMALASCADDETFDSRNIQNPYEEGITFRSGMASRATETTNANLNSIYVSAFTAGSPYFEKENFVKGSDTYFKSNNKYEWLELNEEIKFYAYAPSESELGADIVNSTDSAGLVLSNFVVADSIADQVDFITANATGTRKANESTGVELTFDHRLSQIEVQAKSDNTDYTFKIAGVRIGRAEYMGTFDFNTNKWTLDEWHDKAVYTSYCTPFILGSEAKSIMGNSGNAMLLPQSLTPWNPGGDPDNAARGSYLSVLVQITRTDNGYRVFPYPDDTKPTDNQRIAGYAWASIPLNTTWEQGKKYVYTLDFTEGGGNVDPDDPTPGQPVLNGEIKFNVTVNPWVNSNNEIPMTTAHSPVIG